MKTITLILLLCGSQCLHAALRREYNVTLTVLQPITANTIGYVPNLNEYTLGGWFNYKGSSPFNCVLLKKSNPSFTASEWVLIAEPDGRLEFRQACSTGSRVIVKTGTGAFTSNVWSHIAVTWTRNISGGTNTNSVRIFVNGIEITTRSSLANGTAPPSGDSAQNFVMGEYGGASHAPFTGLMGEVFFCTNQLPDQKIYDLYRMGRYITGVPRFFAETREWLPYFADNLILQYGRTNPISTGSGVAVKQSIYGTHNSPSSYSIFGAGSQVSYP